MGHGIAYGFAHGLTGFAEGFRLRRLSTESVTSMGSTVYDGAGNALTEVFFESSITPIATLECYFYLIKCITSVSNDAAGGGGHHLGGAADSLCEGFAY